MNSCSAANCRQSRIDALLCQSRSIPFKIKKTAQRWEGLAFSAPSTNQKNMRWIVLVVVFAVQFLGNRTFVEQIRQIDGVGRISNGRPARAEDLLHGEQVGGMRKVERTGVRNAIHVPVSMRR